MIGITGASGQFGQRVLHHLAQTLAVPASRIVAATRQPAKLTDWAARGVHVRALDFDDAATFAPAFDDVERVLLISTDALDRPGRRLEQHRRAVDALSAAGVQHVVYTSMPQPDGAPVLIAPDHAGTEQAAHSRPAAGHFGYPMARGAVRDARTGAQVPAQGRSIRANYGRAGRARRATVLQARECFAPTSD